MRVVLVIILIVAVVFALLAVVWIKTQRSRDALELQQPWPMDLGSLAAVRARYPTHDANRAAVRLAELAEPLDVHFARGAHTKGPIFEAIAKYVREQLTRPDDRIDPPSPEVAEFFRKHDAELAAIRQHLLANRPDWKVDFDAGEDAPLPNLLAHLHLTRTLIAHALATGNGDDLRAAWLFALDAWRRPEVISRLIALAETVSIDGSMRKLAPLPWRDELRSFDVRCAMLEGFHADGSLRHDMVITMSREHLIEMPLGRPLATGYASAMRRTAKELADSHDCAFRDQVVNQRILSTLKKWDTIAIMSVPTFTSVWVRTQRFVAQREATDRILAIKAGRWTPDLERSACTDGTWIYMEGTLRFSREIPPLVQGLNVPLTYSRPRQ